MRIPKAGAYIDPSLKQDQKTSSIKYDYEVKDLPVKQENVPPDDAIIENPVDTKTVLAKGLKLKVSNGKIVR